MGIRKQIAKWLDPRPRVKEFRIVARHLHNPAMQYEFLNLPIDMAKELSRGSLLCVPSADEHYGRLDLRVAEMPASILIIFEE